MFAWGVCAVAAPRPCAARQTCVRCLSSSTSRGDSFAHAAARSPGLFNANLPAKSCPRSVAASAVGSRSVPVEVDTWVERAALASRRSFGPMSGLGHARWFLSRRSGASPLTLRTGLCHSLNPHCRSVAERPRCSQHVTESDTTSPYSAHVRAGQACGS